MQQHRAGADAIKRSSQFRSVAIECDHILARTFHDQELGVRLLVRPMLLQYRAVGSDPTGGGRKARRDDGQSIAAHAGVSFSAIVPQNFCD